MTANWIKRLESEVEGRRVLEQERLIFEVTEALALLLEEPGMSRAELARRIGKSPAFVTKLLRGNNNFTLRTMSDVFFALNRSVHLSLGEVGEGVVVWSDRATAPLRIDSSAWGRTWGDWATRAQCMQTNTRDAGGLAA